MSILEQQRFAISEVAADRYRDALCGQPLPAMANNWTLGAAHRHTTAPISAPGLHPVAHELLGEAKAFLVPLTNNFDFCNLLV